MSASMPAQDISLSTSWTDLGEALKDSGSNHATFFSEYDNHDLLVNDEHSVLSKAAYHTNPSSEEEWMDVQRTEKGSLEAISLSQRMDTELNDPPKEKPSDESQNSRFFRATSTVEQLFESTMISSSIWNVFSIPTKAQSAWYTRPATFPDLLNSQDFCLDRSKPNKDLEKIGNTQPSPSSPSCPYSNTLASDGRPHTRDPITTKSSPMTPPPTTPTMTPTLWAVRGMPGAFP
ncbi:hypothetical protein CLU79DRAFT_833153 [Phycomyces nitens]|nr:hypothetical protein CLU79DRAFT_833153 [Phycomyces nitens]